jgi:hypothetical protein
LQISLVPREGMAGDHFEHCAGLGPWPAAKGLLQGEDSGWRHRADKAQAKGVPRFDYVHRVGQVQARRCLCPGARVDLAQTIGLCGRQGLHASASRCGTVQRHHSQKGPTENAAPRDPSAFDHIIALSSVSESLGR